MEEVWKPIIGFEGLYSISNKGRVLSHEKISTRIMRNRPITRIYPEKIRIPSFSENFGYYLVGLHKDGVQYMIAIHRLVALHFILNPDDKPEVNHIDGNKLNNNDYNLEWVTRQENQHHAFTTGLNSIKHLHRKGESHSQVKLTTEQVLEIRGTDNSISQRLIAQKYGVSQHNISSIKLKKSWKHI